MANCLNGSVEHGSHNAKGPKSRAFLHLEVCYSVSEDTGQPCQRQQGKGEPSNPLRFLGELLPAAEFDFRGVLAHWSPSFLHLPSATQASQSSRRC
jgi:hypothetical protein